MLNSKRILVAVDFSPESELALQWAIQVARGEAGASIELCHVLPLVLSPAHPDAMTFGYFDYFAAEKKTVERKLRGLQERIPRGIASAYTIREGGVAHEIAQRCESGNVDLVVLTTHGRRGLSHLLHGSTSEEVVRLAPCPVLVLHLNQATVSTKLEPITAPEAARQSA